MKMDIDKTKTTETTPMNEVDNDDNINITIGPDLNSTKPLLDRKVYRQIMLPNGLRCLLVQDTLAMQQMTLEGDKADIMIPAGDDDGDEDDSSSEDDDENENKMEEDDDPNADGITNKQNSPRQPPKVHIRHHPHHEEDDIGDGDDDAATGNDGNEEDGGDDDDDDDDDGEQDGLRDAAVSLLVGVGSMYDPPSCQGLAHYLEHLLFMGSSKYPGENEYEQFITKYGGSDNAYTEWEYTVYHFTIPQPYLFKGLDRLAQFFIDPLFAPTSVNRELHAIESEFQLNKLSDTNRWEQLFSSTCTKNHPFASFGWGNLKSLQTIPTLLQINPYEELRTFYNQYYYGANMRLVVSGAYPLDYMQKKVIQCFRDVPALPRTTNPTATTMKEEEAEEKPTEEKKKDKVEKDNNNNDNDTKMNETTTTTTIESNQQHEQARTPIYPLPVKVETLTSWDAIYDSPMQYVDTPLRMDRGLQKIFRMIPIKDRHTLSITWQIPPIYSSYESKPTDYIAHLLGHEGIGSILSYLRSESLAVGCTVGVGDSGSHQSSCHALFVATFNLSLVGLQNWTRVVDIVYQYLGLLRYYSHGLNKKSSSNDDESNGDDGDDDDSGFPKYIYDELYCTHAISYKYGDEPSPADFVDTIVEYMAPHMNLPPERILDGISLLFKEDPIAVRTLLDESLIPSKSRIDIMSSTYKTGTTTATTMKEHNEQQEATAEDAVVDTATETTSIDTIVRELQILEEKVDVPFDPTFIPPQMDPMFGTYFWCHELPIRFMERWLQYREPQLPHISQLHLPPVNPFVPTHFELKPYPEDDADHPLLHAAINVCITIKKTKQWLPATIIRYHKTKNTFLLSYEDDEMKWYKVDVPLESFPSVETIVAQNITSVFESTLESKSIKYRLIALSIPGRGPVRLFTDNTNNGTDTTGEHHDTVFPAIPPASLHVPQLLSNTDTFKLWWLQDRQFHRPITDLRCQFIFHEANHTPLHRVCFDIYRLLCLDTLIETTYLASMCELEFNMDITDSGFNTRHHGFDTNLFSFFQTIMNVLLSFRTTTQEEENESNKMNDNDDVDTNLLPKCFRLDRYEACVEILLRKYRNAGCSSSQLVSDIRIQCLRTPKMYSANQLRECLEQKEMTLSLFISTMKKLFHHHFAIECLYHGNITKVDATALRDWMVSYLGNTSSSSSSTNATTTANGDSLTSKSSTNKTKTNKLPSLPRSKYPSQSVAKIPSNLVVPVVTVPAKVNTEPNTSCELYIQIGIDNLIDRTTMDLLMHIMEEPFFDQIRTKDQYGYSVYCSSRWSYGIIGCIFHVTTNVKTATEVQNRIDRFLREFREELIKYTATTFTEYVISLTKDKLHLFNSLSEVTDSYWEEITDGRFQWEVWREEAQYLRTIQLVDLIRVYDDWFSPDKPRRAFTVQVIGNTTPTPSTTTTDNDNNDDDDDNNTSTDKSITTGTEPDTIMTSKTTTLPTTTMTKTTDDPNNNIEDYYDQKISEFYHQVCKKQTCGRVNSKLF